MERFVAANILLLTELLLHDSPPDAHKIAVVVRMTAGWCHFLFLMAIKPSQGLLNCNIQHVYFWYKLFKCSQILKFYVSKEVVANVYNFWQLDNKCTPLQFEEQLTALGVLWYAECVIPRNHNSEDAIRGH